MAERPLGTLLAGDLAAHVSRVRAALDTSVPDPPRRERLKKADWATWPAPRALAAGVPLPEVLRHNVQDALAISLADGFHRPVRATLLDRRRLPVGWYGQQDAPWIAYYDTLRRLGLTRAVRQEFDDWASLARTTGWWWPGEHTCVRVERPAAVDTEPLPGTGNEEVRAVYVGYRDGWQPLGARAVVSTTRDTRAVASTARGRRATAGRGDRRAGRETGN